MLTSRDNCDSRQLLIFLGLLVISMMLKFAAVKRQVNVQVRSPYHKVDDTCTDSQAKNAASSQLKGVFEYNGIPSKPQVEEGRHQHDKADVQQL